MYSKYKIKYSYEWFYISFGFEISSGIYYNSIQLSNLIHFRNEIKYVISAVLIFDLIKLQLIDIICCHSANHYTGYCQFCEVDKLNLQKIWIIIWRCRN